MITDKDRIEKEKRLAEMLAPGSSFVINSSGTVVRDGQYATPHWTRDWSACGPLMVEHECYPDTPGDGSIFCGVPPVYAEVSDHPSKEFAVMYATVCAVIAKLEATKSV
jgi:hypothetical protein